MPYGAAAGVALVTLGVGASLRLVVAIQLVNSSSESALESLGPGEEEMAQVLVGALKKGDLSGDELGAAEREYVEAVAAMSWLLAPIQLPRCGTLCAWRCTGQAWRMLTGRKDAQLQSWCRHAVRHSACKPRLSHSECPCLLLIG
jgi:hypothetical protein